MSSPDPSQINDGKLAALLCAYRGVQGRFAFAQAWHESGGLDSKLARQAHNYWGIKWRSSAHQAAVSFITWEHVHGRDIMITARFASWPSDEAAVAAYWNLVKNRYPVAFNAGTINQFLHGLVDGPRKWATDPKYFQNVERVYYNLIARGLMPVSRPG